MPREVLRPGRICVITRGRDRGKKCVIVGSVDNTSVIVTGPKELNGVKRGRKNILHLMPLAETIRIRVNSKDETVMAALEKSGLKEFMREIVRFEDAC
ncbi:MAG: 50S ribosomal protein L14e [Candidatus Brockarchaeota archaeon]|nr:50S ribosomal protein L14e [Candidatus Brockarchaeota archaeon]